MKGNCGKMAHGREESICRLPGDGSGREVIESAIMRAIDRMPADDERTRALCRGREKPIGMAEFGACVLERIS
jgi:hypothetical protein